MSAKKTRPGPDPERLVIEGDPGAALDKLLGKPSTTDRERAPLPNDKLPEEGQAVRFWTTRGPRDGHTGIFRAKGKLGKSEGIAWAFESSSGTEYRHQVERWLPL